MARMEADGEREPNEFLRVVALRNGRLSPAEFRLREGQQGLSVFACVERPSPAEAIEAVRAAGKRGELAAAVIAAQEIHTLGLILVRTQGGTAQAGVNAIHYEARVPWLRRLFLRLRGTPLHAYFNEQLSHQLSLTARVLDTER
jgi:hypothetical protein